MGKPRAKLSLVQRDPVADLGPHLAALASLPKRALSTPTPALASPAIAAFVELWGSREALRAAFADWPSPARAWLVEETLAADAARTWPSGVSSPGVRLVSSVHRRPDLDRSAFAAHWHGPHTAIALAYSVPVWRYGQNVVVEAWGPEDGEDGFAVLHFRTGEDLVARWADHPGEAQRGAEDAARFMDRTRGWTVTMTETIWEGGPAARA